MPGVERAGLDAWLQSRLDLVALMVVAIGFVVRAITAAAGYLNPDEALHYLLAHQPSVLMVYKASLTSAHPPLLFLLLYVWRVLGNSEFILRLPFVIAGTAMLWTAFRWLGLAFGKTAGLIGLFLLTFSPAQIWLSAEVRGYAFLLFFMTSALYYLERAFEERSPRMMACSSVFLYLAILTEYSALFFTLAVGAYAFVRICGRQLPAGVVKVWVGSQAGASAIYTFLYVTHISTLRGGGMEKEAMSGWLHHAYFQSGEASLLLFPLQRSVSVFQYLFSQRVGGILMLLAFLGGLAFMLAKRLAYGRNQPSPRALGILLLLPFILNCGAAVAGLYPYDGTRHSVFLALFATAGVSVLLGELAGKKTWPVLLAAGVLMPVWNLNSTLPAQHILAQNQRRMLMGRALTYIRQSIPPGTLLFVDHQTSLMLGYYLSRDQTVRFDEPQLQKDFFEYPYGGYRIVSSKLWLFNAKNFGPELSRMRRAYGLAPGELVWVVQAGWGVGLYYHLTMRFPELHLPGLMFGGNLTVFQVPADLEALIDNLSRRP